MGILSALIGPATELAGKFIDNTGRDTQKGKSKRYSEPPEAMLGMKRVSAYEYSDNGSDQKTDGCGGY